MKRQIDCPICKGRCKIRIQQPAWKEVEYGPKYVPCSKCGGRGWIIFNDNISDERTYHRY